jgi:hypothetical protein
MANSLRPAAPLAAVLALASTLLAGPPVPGTAHAETGGVVRGRVTDARTNDPLPGASVRLQGSEWRTVTDERGLFALAGVPPGVYNVEVSRLGYRRLVLPEIAVAPSRPVLLDFPLEDEALATDSVTVVASPFRRSPETPVSARTLGAAEIERFPGADRDLSKVVTSQPGVATAPNFRNDILIRGGAPSENRFFVEGVEVPVVNHFSTQGSTGGPVGMIDVNTLLSVDLLTGAFPANRGNALSSVMDLTLKEGNDQRVVKRVTVGASDAGLSLDGPLGPAARFTLSARRSYLQSLGTLFGLPFLPTYNDAQFRVRWRPSAHDEVNVLGLGAIDDIHLNLDANDTEMKRYILDFLPVTPQWNYTAGATWKHFTETGARTLVLSRSKLDNRSTKYFQNDESDPANLVLDYQSQEAQTSLRAEWLRRRGAWRSSWGAGADAIEYTNHTYQKTPVPTGVVLVDFESRITYPRYAAWGQASRTVAGDRGEVSLGLRFDGAGWSPATANPLEQLSPRLALSWKLARSLRAGASLARYYQLPPNTVLGWRDDQGTLANRESGVCWMRADHAVAGLEWTTATSARFSAEGFFKRYGAYPFLTREGVSLANLGADFGVIGNAPAASTSRGRAYGAELLAQQRLWRGWYGIAAYTWVRSEFTDAAGHYVPAAWDNHHVASLTGGRRFGRGWEAGARWRYLGGGPYTPDDLELSSRREVWDAAGRAQPDWTLLNTGRNGAFHQLDVRVEKQWTFSRTELVAYADVQNVYAFAPKLAPTTAVVRDAAGNPVVDPADPSRYLLKTLEEDPGQPFPTVGLRFTF